MYRPPQNTNRVKSIKSKFENIENESPEKKNGYRGNLRVNNSPQKPENIIQNEKLVVQRQLSDPCRRNIKRTPAFRLDKSVDRTSGFQRNGFNRSTLFENKVKQFSAVKNCDNVDSSNSATQVPKKPLLVKSKSSHDFKYIRSKFDMVVSDNNSESQEQCSESEDLQGVDLSLLYTEPIPKSLRIRNADEVDCPKIQSENIYNKSTLKISDKPSNKQPYDSKDDEKLTDTLKTALKKPLPNGPPPKKPPRTFQHTVTIENLEKNISFLHVESKPSNTRPKVAPKKADPKYMLNKLETALRNNKLRARRQAKTDISTSGEDSDDSLLFRSKSNRTLPKLPSPESENATSAFNLNCLNGLGCAVSNYEKIKEPNSLFFVDNTEEPVYSEPYHYLKESMLLELRMREKGSSETDHTSKSLRNSLYYMSTPVLNGGSKTAMSVNGSSNMQDETKTSESKLNCSYPQNPSAENSSLSSFTSDLDSTPSPMDETSKIRSLIDNYENKSFIDHPTVDSGQRVEQLKNSIRKTLERSFSCDSAMRDSDSETNDNELKVSDIVKKFETYRQTMPKYCKPKVHKDTLFFCCLIIEKVKDVAQIKFKYPANVDVPENLESLCFPESDISPLEAMSTAQSYSLLITNDKGERMFGYCRRVLPEGSSHCLPLAYCILSKYRAPRFYKKILAELESRHGMKNKIRDDLIKQFYNQKFPKPGDSIKINLTNIEPKTGKTDDLEFFEDFFGLNGALQTRIMSGDDGTLLNETDMRKRCTMPSYIRRSKEKTELILTLHPDTRYEDCDLKKLHQLPADVLLKIFSSLLLERKVILISSSIG
ncbi:unnamed protein product [Acanthoscelides obtectus]|nr:unnamed protein product [Acanthoscelides obtectus]CAK1621691.1 DENN domain-containing protein 2A [Acanthoscelides obtectus]